MLKRHVSLNLLTVVVLTVAAVLGLRGHQRRKLRPFVDLTRTYLQRALAGDSVGMRALATDDTAVAWTLALARHEPDRIRLALKTLRATGGHQDAAVTVVFFHTDVDWCAGVAGATDLQAAFYHVDTTWKVHYTGPGPC